MGQYNFQDADTITAAMALSHLEARVNNQAQVITALQQRLIDASSTRLNLKTPLTQNGFTGKLLAHYMGWFGEPGKTHKVTRYNSTDTQTVHNIVTAAKLCGIDGFVATWFGLTSAFINQATIMLWQECEAQGMLFALLLDPWSAKFPGKTKEQSLIDSLNASSTQQMLQSKLYIPEKAVLDFSTGADFSKIAPNVSHGLEFWRRHQDYSWPETTNTMAVLKRDNASPSMRMPCVCASFFDGGFFYKADQRDWNRSVWDSNTDTRIIPDEGGNTYLDTVALVPKTAPYAAIVTLNDHDEQTAILPMLSMLTGIRFGK